MVWNRTRSVSIGRTGADRCACNIITVATQQHGSVEQQDWALKLGCHEPKRLQPQVSAPEWVQEGRWLETLLFGVEENELEAQRGGPRMIAMILGPV